MNYKFYRIFFSIIILVLVATLPVLGDVSEEPLAQEEIKVKITIDANVETHLPEDEMEMNVEAEDLNLNLYDNEIEDNPTVDTADEIDDEDFSTSMEFNIQANQSMSISVESEEGFSEEINDFFRYKIRGGVDDKEEAAITPSGRLEPGVIQQEPGQQSWELELSLEEEKARQWQSLSELEEEELENIDEEWTELAAGEYEDKLVITLHGE